MVSEQVDLLAVGLFIHLQLSPLVTSPRPPKRWSLYLGSRYIQGNISQLWVKKHDNQSWSPCAVSFPELWEMHQHWAPPSKN